MKKSMLVALLLGLAVLPAVPASALAQQAAAAPTVATAAAKPAEMREVYPRDLMTIRERFDMWRAMRAAKTYEEKMDLWAAKYAELEKRAADKGVRLVEMGPMMMQHSGTARDNGNGQKSERRMGMMRPEGGGGWSGMRPHPPMGR